MMLAACRTRTLLLTLCLMIDGALSAVIVYAMVTRWSGLIILVTATLQGLALIAAVMLFAAGLWLMAIRTARLLVRFTASAHRHLSRHGIGA